MAYNPSTHIKSKGARFVPGRRKYDREKVKIMRAQMAARKSNREGISDEQYQSFLGKLQAAGHMKINGFQSFKVDRKMMEPTPFIPNDKGSTIESYNIGFDTSMTEGMKGNRPHITGYLTSASDNDKEYKLKGWFNEDGTIRIVIVN